MVSPCATFDKGPQRIQLSPVPPTPMVLNAQDFKVLDQGESKHFNQWLSEKIAAEREACASQLKEVLNEQLEEYRQACVKEVKAHLAGQPGGSLFFNNLFSSAGSEPNSNADLNAPPLSSSGVPTITHQSSHVSLGASASPLRNPSNLVELRGGTPAENVPTPSPPLGEDEQNKNAAAAPSQTTQQHNKMVTILHSMHKGGHEFEIDENQPALLMAAQRLVLNTKFELVSLWVILLNTVSLALEMQYTGFETGNFVDFPGRHKTAEDTWPNAKDVFLGFSIGFNCFFILELLVRLMAMRSKALSSKWIWLDSILVPLGVLDVLYTMDVMEGLGFNPTMLRVARLLRMMRVARTMKNSDSFHSLFLLMKSVHACVTALFWSILLLLLIMLGFGMLLNQMLYTYFKDEGENIENRRKVWKYFGTFTRVMLTMFEITFANWITPTRVIMQYVGEGVSFIIVFYRCIFCFAVLNVIRAVFITETNRVAQSDDEVAMMVREANSKSVNKKMDTLFQALDHSGDGNIDWQDFVQGLQDPILKKYMSMLDIECHDLESLFHLLDNGDGKVDWKEFSHNVSKLRGNAKSLDMIKALAAQYRLEIKLDALTNLFRPVQPTKQEGKN